MKGVAWGLKSLRRHGLRTALSLAGIAVAAAMLLDMVMLSGGIDESFADLLLKRGYQVRLTPKGTLPFDTEATMSGASGIVAAAAARSGRRGGRGGSGDVAVRAHPRFHRDARGLRHRAAGAVAVSGRRGPRPRSRRHRRHRVERGGRDPAPCRRRRHRHPRRPARPAVVTAAVGGGWRCGDRSMDLFLSI